MTKCDVCKQKEESTECPLCGNQVCEDCLIDGKCLPCSQKTQSDSTGMTEQQIPQTLPPEFKKFNWGAFGCTFIWAAAMKRWGWFAVMLLSMVSFMPHELYVHVEPFLRCGQLIAAIYLGINGNRLAWESRDWDNLQQFRETQNVWAFWGKVLFGVAVLLTVVFIVMDIAMMWSHHPLDLN